MVNQPQQFYQPTGGLHLKAAAKNDSTRLVASSVSDLQHGFQQARRHEDANQGPGDNFFFGAWVFKGIPNLYIYNIYGCIMLY